MKLEKAPSKNKIKEILACKRKQLMANKISNLIIKQLPVGFPSKL